MLNQCLLLYLIVHVILLCDKLRTLDRRPTTGASSDKSCWQKTERFRWIENIDLRSKLKCRFHSILCLSGVVFQALFLCCCCGLVWSCFVVLFDDGLRLGDRRFGGRCRRLCLCLCPKEEDLLELLARVYLLPFRAAQSWFNICFQTYWSYILHLYLGYLLRFQLQHLSSLSGSPPSQFQLTLAQFLSPQLYRLSLPLLVRSII